MAREKRFLARQLPNTRRTLAWYQLRYLVNKKEGWSVRNDGIWPRKLAHCNASNSFGTVSFGEILYQACSTLPSSSMRNALRLMPMNFLPYRERSPYTP